MNQPLPYKNRTVFLVITLMCFIVYGNTLRNGYNLDDAWAFQEKGESGLVEGIEKSFTTSFVTIGELNYGYRPITSAVFVLEQAVFGQNPFVSHFINILIYAVVCFLLFLWLSKYLNVGGWLALAITGAFLFLPIHSEVVNSVKNRDELLSAVFGLLFLMQAWRYYKQGGVFPIILMVVFFALSVLSKASTLPLLLVVPIGLWLVSELHKKRLAIMVLVPALLFLGVWKGIGSIDHGEIKKVTEQVDNPLYGEHTKGDKAKVVVNSFGFYLTGMVSLHSFGAYYGYDTINFLKIHLSYSVAVILFVVTGFVLLFLFFKSHKFKTPLFGMVFLAICIAPFTNLVQKMPGVVGERLAFLASVGFAMLLGYMLYKFITYLKLKKGKSGLYIGGVCAAALTLFWSVKTIQRNADWYSLETLMAADLEKYPNSVKMNMIMGSVQYNKGVRKEGKVQKVIDLKQVERGYNHFAAALKVYDKHPTAIYNMAWIDTYIRESDLDSTESMWWKLVEMEVLDSTEIMPHIATILTKREKPEDVLRLCMEACKEGNHQMGLTGIRQALLESEWQIVWEFSECLYEDIGLRRKQLTEIWKGLMQKDPEKGKALMKALVKLDDSPYYAKINIQNLMQQKKFPEAMALLSDIDERFPDDVEIKLLFGNIYTSFNQTDNALRSFKEALALDPDNEGLRKHVESLEAK